jgi:hypothetical protein
MDRNAIQAIFRMFTNAVLLTTLVGIIIAIIGFSRQWTTTLQYSNAFFIAGSILIIAGASSRLNAGQEIDTHRLLNAQAFREMSSAERTDFIVAVNSSYRTLILGVLSGLLLIAISAFVAYVL